jgi:hypothetical protein
LCDNTFDEERLPVKPSIEMNTFPFETVASAVSYDTRAKQYVFVGVDDNSNVWWSKLPLNDLSDPLAWSDPELVPLNPGIVWSGTPQLTMIKTTSTTYALLLSRLINGDPGDTVIAWIVGDSHATLIPGQPGKQIGQVAVAVSQGDQGVLQLLASCNDGHLRYLQWVWHTDNSATWKDWGSGYGAGDLPAVGYSGGQFGASSSTWILDTKARPTRDVQYCWAWDTSLSYSRWYSLGNLPSGANTSADPITLQLYNPYL